LEDSVEKTISKSKLKAQMLAIFREIESTGESLIVTDHNRPVLKISPISPKSDVSDLFRDIRGQIVFLEDMNAPTLEEWEDA
jgi:antitoxin (DNA-binding transcriptional repressor) of toxin-antitoxin stability system